MSGFSHAPPADRGETLDFQGIRLAANDSKYHPLILSNADDACLAGFECYRPVVLVAYMAADENRYDGDGALVEYAIGDKFNYEASHLRNVMDGFSPRATTNTAAWTVSGVYARGVRVDFVENDQCLPRHIHVPQPAA